VTYIPGKIEVFELDKVTLALPDVIPPDGELAVVELITVKVSVTAAVDDVVAACESVNVVPEIAETNVLPGMPLPVTPIPTQIEAFEADKATLVLPDVTPVAVVVCVVELTVAMVSVTAVPEDDAVAAVESVNVVPEIAATVVPVAIPVPVTDIPTLIEAFEADKVTVVLPDVTPVVVVVADIDNAPMVAVVPVGIQTLFAPFGKAVAAVVFVKVPSLEVPQFPRTFQSSLVPPVNT
jgi:hypothetical protein